MLKTSSVTTAKRVSIRPQDGAAPPAEVVQTLVSCPRPRHVDVNELDRDPMTHVKVFASDEMAGRRGGTEGFDKASKYVSDFLTRYGVKGVTGEVENPYFQTFQLSSMGKKVQNVVGRIEGTGPHKDEAIVLLAHLDHLGTVGRHEIFRGADDNASGSGTLLSTVPALMEMQKRGELDRSIVLLWTAAEEEGLVGSRYFVRHPLPDLPLSKIKGAINMDMVGRWDADRLSIIDDRLSIVDETVYAQPTFFRGLIEKANARLEHPFERFNRDIGAYRTRQDGAEFDRVGIPTLFLFEGLSNPNGGGSLHPEYHTKRDEIALILRDNNGDKVRKLRDLAVGLAGEASRFAFPTPKAAPAPRKDVVVWTPGANAGV